MWQSSIRGAWVPFPTRGRLMGSRLPPPSTPPTAEEEEGARPRGACRAPGAELTLAGLGEPEHRLSPTPLQGPTAQTACAARPQPTPKTRSPKRRLRSHTHAWRTRLPSTGELRPVARQRAHLPRVGMRRWAKTNASTRRRAASGGSGRGGRAAERRGLERG